jgi:hypothetical protein
MVSLICLYQNNPNMEVIIMDNYQQQPYNAPPPYPPPVEPPKKSGMAIASLILGILSIPSGCCYGLGIILGIVGIILGVMSKKDSGQMSGMAIAGIICSCFGIVFGIAFWVLFIIGLQSIGGINSILDLYNYYN